MLITLPLHTAVAPAFKMTGTKNVSDLKKKQKQKPNLIQHSEEAGGSL